MYPEAGNIDVTQWTTNSSKDLDPCRVGPYADKSPPTTLTFPTTPVLSQSQPMVEARGPELRIVRRFVELWLGSKKSTMWFVWGLGWVRTEKG
jgi:hypothetical protein